MVVVFLVIIHVNDGPRGGGGMGMRRSNAPFILALLCAAPPCVVEAQFGSLQVDWSTGGSASVSDSIRPKPDAYVVPGEARVFNLWELVKNDPEQLKSIVESFQIGGCDACQSDGHWVAKVRSDTACAAIGICAHLAPVDNHICLGYE